MSAGGVLLLLSVVKVVVVVLVRITVLVLLLFFNVASVVRQCVLVLLWLLGCLLLKAVIVCVVVLEVFVRLLVLTWVVVSASRDRVLQVVFLLNTAMCRVWPCRVRVRLRVCGLKVSSIPRVWLVMRVCYRGDLCECVVSFLSVVSVLVVV